MRKALVPLVLLVCSVIYSCSKNDPHPANTDIPTTPNTPNKPDTVDHSKKQINAVVFRAADNSSLANDVSGIVNADTVKFLFKYNTALNNLVPDISFLGKSISPANKTPRDFTNPVTYTITAEDGTTRKYVLVCTVSADPKKQINTVVFRSADNSVLADDVSAIVGADTVKCLLAPNTAINNLVPDISFLGRSISPANKTARDFTSPVTYTITAEDGTTKQYVVSCSVAADSAAMLVGKWTLVKDSSTNNNFATSDGVYLNPGVYIGQPGDYFEFTSTGLLNMRANNQTGTGFKYHIVPNARLYIDIMSPWLDDGYIQILTPNKAVLFWTKTSVTGGKYTRTTWLKK